MTEKRRNNPFEELENQIARVRQEITSMSEGKPIPEFIGTTEASELLGLSKSSIYKRTMNGTIPFYKIGRKLRFSRSELHEFIKKGQVESDPLPGPGITIEN